MTSIKVIELKRFSFSKVFFIAYSIHPSFYSPVSLKRIAEINPGSFASIIKNTWVSKALADITYDE